MRIPGDSACWGAIRRPARHRPLGTSERANERNQPLLWAMLLGHGEGWEGRQMIERGVGQGRTCPRALFNITHKSFYTTCSHGQVVFLWDRQRPASGLTLEGGC